MNFATMEFTVASFMTEVLGIEEEAGRAIIDATGSKFEAKGQLLLKFLSITEIDKQFFSEVEALVNYASNTICPVRNRLVHDLWASGENDAVQIDSRAQLKRQGAHTAKAIGPRAKVVRPLEKIWLLVQDVIEINAHLTRRWQAYVLWKHQGQPVQHLPLPTFHHISRYQ